jgi:hypothetical protein
VGFGAIQIHIDCVFAIPAECDPPVPACINRIPTLVSARQGLRTFACRKRTYPAIGQKIPPPPRAGSVVQTFLRMLGIEVSFTRDGRAGTRTIRMKRQRRETEQPASVLSAASAPSAVAPITFRPTLEGHHKGCCLRADADAADTADALRGLSNRGGAGRSPRSN